jgi:hypothetical protein
MSDTAPKKAQNPQDKPYEPPKLRKEGELTRVVNASGLITISAGRGD